jgi:hypothetical protein
MLTTLTAFSSEGSFTCHTYCDTGPPSLRSYPEDPWFSLLIAVLLTKKQSIHILNIKFDVAGTSGARTHDLPDAKRSITTRLPHGFPYSGSSWLLETLTWIYIISESFHVNMSSSTSVALEKNILKWPHPIFAFLWLSPLWRGPDP